MKKLVAVFLSANLLWVTHCFAMESTKNELRKIASLNAHQEIVIDKIDQEIKNWEENPLDMSVISAKIKTELSKNIDLQVTKANEILALSSDEEKVEVLKESVKSLSNPEFSLEDNEDQMEYQRALDQLNEIVTPEYKENQIKDVMTTLNQYENYKDYLESVKRDIQTGELISKAKLQKNEKRTPASDTGNLVGGLIVLSIIIGVSVILFLIHPLLLIGVLLGFLLVEIASSKS